MTKKKSNKLKKLPWSNSVYARLALYDGVNPSADFGIGSLITLGIGYLGGFRTGRGMSEDEARWAAYLGLPYDKEYAPDTNIRFELDKNYPDRQYLGISKRAKDEIREEVIPEAKRIKDKYNKEWIQVLDERGTFGNDSTIYHPRETYTGDLGKFGIREVGNSGIYEIGDKYDFPSWIPVPDRNEGTELMIRDTIWSDRANPKLYNKEIIKRKNNKYSFGSWFNNAAGNLSNWNDNATKNFMSSQVGLGLGKLGISSGGMGSMLNTAATAVGGLLAGKNETGVGNAMQKIGSLASNIPGIGGVIGAGVNLLGGVVNAAFGSSLNEENIAKTQGLINELYGFQSNAGDYDALASNYASMPNMGYFSKDSIGTDGWFSNKAKNKWKELRADQARAENWIDRSLAGNARNIAATTLLNLEANYSADGGPINMLYSGVMSPFGNRFDGGGFFSDVMDAYINPKTTAGIIGKGAVLMLDPTGISSYPDVWRSGEELFEDPSWETAKDFGINLIGALPLIGKVTAPFKAAKMTKMLSRVGDANAIVKGVNEVNKVNRVIDTLPELLPITRKATEKVQDFTTKWVSDPLFDYYSAANKVDKVRDYRNANTAINTINIANNAADIGQFISSFTNKKSTGGPLDVKRNNKRTYIGGTTAEARKKYFNYDKELTQIVTNLATSYGISPALVIDRLAHEGIIDSLINDHNAHVQRGGEERPSRAFSTNVFNSPYGLFGLDYIFDTYTKGVTKTKRPINIKKLLTFNESGEAVNSGETNNTYDTLELFTAELASRRNQVKEQYPNLTDTELDSATAARYNATNRYFRHLMDSGEYKVKYPINTDGINIPTPTKTDSKYIKDQTYHLDLDDTFRNMPYKEYIYDNKSWNPNLFLENGEVIDPDNKIVKGIMEGYVRRNYSEPDKVKFVQENYKYGGQLTHGGIFSNGVEYIGNGGTHEENPNEGVLMGVDPQGVPNLVEEGEVIWNDYVFSNRLKVPKAIRLKYKLKDNITFADAAKCMLKESEERPNDPISQDGLNALFSDLAMALEEVRMKKNNNKLARGGKLGKKYDGYGTEDLWLDLMSKLDITFNPGEYKKEYTRLDAMLDMARLKAAKLTSPIPEKQSPYSYILDRNKGDFNVSDYNPQNNRSTNSIKLKNDPLRYAPIIGHGLSVFSDLFSSPDYAAAEQIEGLNIQPALVRNTPISNYLRYEPLDRSFYLNKMGANAAAARRAIANTAGGNRAAAMAGILGADYGAMEQYGNLARQAEEYNQALRERVETFNRGTNLSNAEASLKALMANADSRNAAQQLKLKQVTLAAALRQAAKDAYNARRSNNLNVFLEELGGLGTENTFRNMIDWMAERGVLRVDSEGNYVLPKDFNMQAKGGLLKTKKKKGFTYG